MQNSVSLETADDLSLIAYSSDSNIKFHTGGFPGGGAQSYERMRIDSAGNVGIGVQNPDSLLHLKDPTGIASIITLERNDTAITTGNGVGQIRFQHQDSGNEGLCAIFRVEAGDTSGTGEFVFQSGLAGTLTEKMRIDSSGNMGIGTSSPDTLLHISDTSPHIDIGPQGGNRGKIGYHDLDVYIGSTSSTGKIIFKNNIGSTDSPQTSGDTKMVITDTGVGIGIASPANPLHIYAASAGATATHLNLQNNSSIAGTTVEIRLAPTPYDNDIGSTARWSAIQAISGGSGNPTNLAFLTNGVSSDPVERMRIDSSGRVGIGTDSPADELHIKGIDPALRFEDTSAVGYARLEATNGSMVYEADQGNTVGNSTHIFKVDSDEKMRINSSGNVGIGETSPSSILHISVADHTQGIDGRAIRIDNDTSGRFGVIGVDDLENMYLWNGTNSGTGNIQFYTGGGTGTERVRLNSAGHLAVVQKATIGGGSTTTSPDAVFTVQDSGATIGKITAVFGADANSNSLTNSTSKETRIGIPHYNTAEEPAALIFSQSISSENQIVIGGGTSRMNAATSIEFRTAANSTTVTGTERMRIDAYGGLNIKSVGGTQAATFGGSNLVNGITALPSSAGVPFVVGRDTGSLKSATFAGHVNINTGYGLSFDSGANYLDDYEEGTFNITLTDSNSGSDTLKMKYVKIGRVVTIEGPFRGSEGSTASTFFQLSGTADSNLTLSCSLPFTPRDSGCCISPIHRNMERRSDGLNPDQGYALPVLAWAAGNATCYLTDTQTEKAYDGATGTGGGNTWRKADTRTNVVLQFNAVYMTDS